MKILVAPLNWGLGHASRCIPLIRSCIAQGDEVVLGGDGDSLTLLKRHFPQLRTLPLAPLNLRYGRSRRQVLPIAQQLPKLLLWTMMDRKIMAYHQSREHFDRIISDNRFGIAIRGVETVYITHQLHIPLPKGWKWAEPLAERWHRRIIERYTQCWVPDYADAPGLAGELSHPKRIPNNTQYIGPLSRFTQCNHPSPFKGAGGSAVALLSGLEPQRTIFEQEIIARYEQTGEELLIVQGLVGAPKVRIRQGHITTVPHLSDEELVEVLVKAERIICRSGYSTIMDLHALGLLERAELHATPGQPEQEYLATMSTRTNLSRP